MQQLRDEIDAENDASLPVFEPTNVQTLDDNTTQSQPQQQRQQQGHFSGNDEEREKIRQQIAVLQAKLDGSAVNDVVLQSRQLHHVLAECYRHLKRRGRWIMHPGRQQSAHLSNSSRLRMQKFKLGRTQTQICSSTSNCQSAADVHIVHARTAWRII